jgi:hypothetical protein
VQLTTEQQEALAGIARLEALLDEATEAADGDVLLLRRQNRRLERDRDKAIDTALRYCDEAHDWRERYIAMRRERDAAMDEWVNSVTRQLGVEEHLAAHQRQIDLSRKCDHDQVARQLMERIELWIMKKEVEAADLGLDD